MELAERQAGALSWGQLNALGVTRGFVRSQVDASRWRRRTESVFTTTTGPLTEEQRRWVAVLHCGPGALIGGLTALQLHGLQRWERPDVCVIVENADSFEPVSGVTTFRTRRPLAVLRTDGPLPLCRAEAAALLWAAHERHPRSAMGLLAATVQQGLATAEQLLAWTEVLKPLRRAPVIRELLADILGGSQSLAEVDVVRMCRVAGLQPPRRQSRRRDRAGRLRYTDCEWDLPDGRVLVLEVDGAFHVDVQSYGADVKRQRGLTTPDRIVIRCTSQEVRREPWEVTRDLVALGVPRLSSSR